MSLNAQFRVLYGSPLSRPKVAKFAVIILVVMTTITTSILVKNLLTSRSLDQLRVFFLALFWSGLLSIIPIAILRFLDRRERECTWLYVLTFLWGALIATGIAQPINALILGYVKQFLTLHPDIQQFFGSNGVMIIGAPLAGPIVEETTKGIGVLLLFWLLQSEFDNVRDGFIYGALVGIGFNFIEAATYVLAGYVDNGIAPWGGQLIARYAPLGFIGHPLFTGMFGLGLGLARQTMRVWLRYTAPIIGWLMGFSGHLYQNGLGLLIFLLGFATAKDTDAHLAKLKLGDTPPLQAFIHHGLVKPIMFLPFVLVTVVMLWQSGIWERQVICEELASEVEPVITKEEYEAVKSDRIFRTRRIQNINQDTNRRTRAAIVQAQNELAIRKWLVKQKGQVVETDPVVLSWRNELLRLRDDKTLLHSNKQGV
ncbi:hypothetical protein NIES2101_36270 [Calothrix sp. HK-06]|nr:hypothetical protein NIES2101_36270 [Calothrix sp. HK-06]